jgi:hypothetical protein
MEEIEYNLIESYVLFINVDDSILQLNPVIEKHGYQFIFVNLEELENRFSDLFHLPKKFTSETRITSSTGRYSISLEFYNLIQSNHHFGIRVFERNGAFFLKRIMNFEQKIINNTISLDEATKVGSELNEFSESLIQQLRLYKKGDIASAIEFQIDANTRHVGYKAYNFRKTFGQIKYELTTEDILKIDSSFVKSFRITDLTELAISNFNLSYEIADIKIRYIILITSLESLFNVNANQITHTISRHLSLIMSNNELEFQDNYSLIKKLYDIRSAIIHGGTKKENYTKVTSELQEKVRFAINYCSKLEISKKQLFDKLNNMGFSSK